MDAAYLKVTERIRIIISKDSYEHCVEFIACRNSFLHEDLGSYLRNGDQVMGDGGSPACKGRLELVGFCINSFSDMLDSC